MRWPVPHPRALRASACICVRPLLASPRAARCRRRRPVATLRQRSMHLYSAPVAAWRDSAMTRCRASPALCGTVRHAAKQARKFNHRCTPMHADGPGSGMLVNRKTRPAGHDDPRRRGGRSSIGVHRRASVVEFSCLLSRRPHSAATMPDRATSAGDQCARAHDRPRAMPIRAMVGKTLCTVRADRQRACVRQPVPAAACRTPCTNSPPTRRSPPRAPAMETPHAP